MTTLTVLRPNLILEQEAAASWARMERERGRELDVNRSTVDRGAQMELYLDYKEGRSNVLALHPDESWHCYPRARAVDTDDDVWIRNHPDHGWRFVVRSERWHAQYYPELDKYRGTGNPANTKEKNMALDDNDKAWVREAVRQEVGGGVSQIANLTEGDKGWIREAVRQELGGALSAFLGGKAEA